MTLLELISLGTWSSKLPQAQGETILALFWTVAALIGLKVLFNFFVDMSSKNRGLTFVICSLVARIVQGSLYILAFMSLGMFHSVFPYLLYTVLLIMALIVLGISFVAEESGYLLAINVIIRKKCEDIDSYITNKNAIKKKCSTINKEINGYLKNALVK